MKIVYESLNEFQRGQDPMKALEIGGKLQKIKEWLSPILFSSQYRINEDYTIDIIRGDFIAMESLRDGIPDYVQFNHCVRDFIIENRQLPDMMGCPSEVGGSFVVSSNNIQTLNGSPKIVHGDYIISRNTAKFTKEDILKVCEVKGRVIV
jgi:hypothetical protein